MIVTKKALPRRTFLRGMGTALALPLLDAMLPPMTALAGVPTAHAKRLGFLYVPPIQAPTPRPTPRSSVPPHRSGPRAAIIIWAPL
jgi:hypothetical protein